MSLLRYGETLTIPSYQLIHRFQDITTGSVLLQCREQAVTSLTFLNVSNAIFKENTTDVDLRERCDMTVTETEDQLGIAFNLTRNVEGYFTCGRKSSAQQSQPKPIICKPLII